jgi:hypothetical protein
MDSDVVWTGKHLTAVKVNRPDDQLYLGSRDKSLSAANTKSVGQIRADFCCDAQVILATVSHKNFN